MYTDNGEDNRAMVSGSLGARYTLDFYTQLNYSLRVVVGQETFSDMLELK